MQKTVKKRTMKSQEPDTIYLGGKKRELHTFPLEIYWQGKRKKPVFVITSTYCWRGYNAKWKIIDNQLFLTDILGKMIVPVEEQPRNIVEKILPKMLKKKEIQKNREVWAELEYLFPGRMEKRIKADWFTGNLNIPEPVESGKEKYRNGKPVLYETVVTIHRGNVVLVCREQVRSGLNDNEYLMRTARN